jgi:hypothetical protein
MILTKQDKQRIKERWDTWTPQQKSDALKMLEMDRKREAIEDYSVFSKSYIKITNKKGQTVNLTQNYVQTQINDKIEELQSRGIPPRIIVLKSRQMGVSTDTQGRMVHKTTTKENRNGLIVAHKEDSTKAIFEKAKYMHDYLPDDLKPLKKASNAKELVFDKPTDYRGDGKGLHSKIVIQTAGSTSIGRSETYHYVHLSEYAFWEGSDTKSPDKQLSGIMQSVPDDVDTWVIIESTANGMNEFYTLWNDALNGKVDFVPMFFPWHSHEEYTVELSYGEEEGFISSFSEYEQWLYNDLKLPLGRIKWWRNTLRTKCNGDINQMKQENPTTANEAFLFSGTPVFNNEKVQQRIEVLRLEYEKNPYKCGYFTFKWNNEEYKDFILPDSVEFNETSLNDKRGIVRIYENVKHGYPYVIGGDTKGEGHDSYTATVINNATSKRCATLKLDINHSKPFTWQIYCMGMYFNKALIGIEMNFNTAPIEELERLRYTNQYQRQKYDDFTGKFEKKYGWKTDGTTRPLIIDNEVSIVEDHLDVFSDIETLQEMITFVKDKNGRPDAMSGKHDDLLLSDMIANEIRSQGTYTVKEEEPEVKEKLIDKLGLRDVYQRMVGE